jgi:hypothetical protein
MTERATPVLILFTLLLAGALAPLALVTYLPLDDYLIHLARMHVLTAIGASDTLGEFYTVHWAVLPNLAIDGLVPALATRLPLETAMGLVAALALVLIASGALALSAVLTGRLTFWPLLIFLFLYSRVLLMGFFNYLVGLGLGMWLVAGWILLRERGRALRITLFTVLTLLLFFVHLYAFGLVAITLLGYEIGRRRLARAPLLGDPAEWATLAVPFAIPAVLFLVASPTAGAALAFHYPPAHEFLLQKARAVYQVFFNYHVLLDRATAVVVFGALALGVLGGWITIDRRMRWPLGLLAAAYLVMPSTVFGTNLASFRLPVAWCVLFVASSRPSWRGLPWPRALAAAVLALFLVRTGIVAERWHDFAGIHAGFVEAIREVPEGSRFVMVPARPPGPFEVSAPPLMYLNNLVIILRDGWDPTFIAEPHQQPVRLRPRYAALQAEIDRRLEEVEDARRCWRTPPLETLLGEDRDEAASLLPAFDHLTYLYPPDDANPAPELLEQLHVAPLFHIYRVRGDGHAADE